MAGISKKPWAEGRGNAAAYFEQFGLKCCAVEEFAAWFSKADRASTPARKLEHFCADCLLSFEQQNREAGTCIKPM